MGDLDDLWETGPRKLLEEAYFPSPEGPYSPDTGRTGWAASFGISVKAQAAILLRIPESGDPDLDAMIRTAQRRDLAAQCVSAMFARSDAEGSHISLTDCDLRDAVEIADAILSALSHPVAEKEG